MSLKKSKTRKDSHCIICKEGIKKGDERYRFNAQPLDICAACIKEWENLPKGVTLGNIPRSVNKNRF